MTVRAIHLVPDAFHRERVLADDQRPQSAQQYRQRFLVDGAVEAFDAALGADAHVVVRERQSLRFAVDWIDERLGAPLLVQMQRIHLVLAVESLAPAHACPTA